MKVFDKNNNGSGMKLILFLVIAVVSSIIITGIVSSFIDLNENESRIVTCVAFCGFPILWFGMKSIPSFVVGCRNLNIGCILTIILYCLFGVVASALVTSICQEFIGDDYPGNDIISTFVFLGWPILISFLCSCFSSLKLACNGIKRKKNNVKTAKELDKIVQNEKYYLEKLSELKTFNVKSNAVERMLRFCKLFKSLDETSQFEELQIAVIKRKEILLAIEQIEMKLFNIAVAYKNIGNLGRAKYILNQININGYDFDNEQFDKEYKTEQETIKKENEALKKWMFVSLIVVVSTICILGYLLLSWVIKE